MKLSEKLIFKPSQIKTARGKVEVELPDFYMSYQERDKNLEKADLTESQKIYKEEQISIGMEEINVELANYKAERLKIIEEELKSSENNLEIAKSNSENLAFSIIQEAKEKTRLELEKVKIESEQLIEKGKSEVERMLKEAEMRTNEIEHEAYQKGYEAGRELGYKSGETESERLINRLGTIISRAVEIREKLISETEKQMIDIVLMIARKVIKDEVLERKSIVLNNIREALKRIKNQNQINIRVNLSDLDLSAAHKDELIKTMEGLKNLNIYEDSRIERGGCIIETDVGSVDLRISTQLKLIEDAIKNAEPI